jgi:hypothetical protein
MIEKIKHTMNRYAITDTLDGKGIIKLVLARQDKNITEAYVYKHDRFRLVIVANIYYSNGYSQLKALVRFINEYCAEQYTGTFTEQTICKPSFYKFLNENYKMSYRIIWKKEMQNKIQKELTGLS